MMDKEMAEIMIDDYLTDHYGEDDPLQLDGDPYVNENGEWEQAAHDNTHAYTLVAGNDGDVRLVP